MQVGLMQESKIGQTLWLKPAYVEVLHQSDQFGDGMKTKKQVSVTEC